MTKVGRVGRPEARSPVATLWRVATTPAILIAGVLYVLGLVLWLAVLSQLDLSLAIPILGTSYATVPLAARVLLGERVSPIRWVGIGMIFAGVVLVARS
ncbi:MAG: EamA family transporter [Chloroflexi bacterium]|nr:EamA family transporter [Chloroflexota bacterium]